MPGINTGSFWGRMGNAAAGMTNGLAQQFGAPDMANTVRGSSTLLGQQKRQKMPKMPKPTNGIPAGQMPGTPVKMEMPGMMAPMPQTGGIDTRPSPQMMPNGGGMNFPGFGGGFWNPGAPKLDVNTGQYNTPSMPNIGGLFGAYNRIRF